MKVITTIEDLRKWRKPLSGQDVGSVGFVPTMGCLHAGHRSLIERSIEDNAYTVVSIFVNPSQFAPTEDLDSYPRTFDQDKALLEEAGVDVLFAPQAREIYPRGIPLEVEKQEGPFVSVLGVSEKLEGMTRPNFFRGVATVVAKLFNIVSPDNAYFGQKDLQQFVVLQTMVNELFFDLKLVMMPIKRSRSGLALSSRNKYLCEESLEVSSNIFKGLQLGNQIAQSSEGGFAREELVNAVQKVWQPFIESGDFKVDYISLANADTLNEVETPVQRNQDLVISCAVYVTDRKDKTVIVRLIDNVLIPRI